MVGDFQQSIYRRPRRPELLPRSARCAGRGCGSGEKLEFSVTFRLDQKQLDFVNATFREILNDADWARCVSLNCIRGRTFCPVK